MKVGVGKVSRIILFWPEEVESHTEGFGNHAGGITGKKGEEGLRLRLTR